MDLIYRPSLLCPRKQLLRFFPSPGKWHHHPPTQFPSRNLFFLHSALAIQQSKSSQPFSSGYPEFTHTSLYLHLYCHVQTMIDGVSFHNYPNSHLSVTTFTIVLSLFILLTKEGVENLSKSQIRLSLWCSYSPSQVKIFNGFP